MKKASKSLFISETHKQQNIENVIKQVSKTIEPTFVSNLIDTKQFNILAPLSESFSKIYNKFTSNKPEYINSFNSYLKDIKEAIKPQFDIDNEFTNNIQNTILEVKKIISNEPMYDNLLEAIIDEEELEEQPAYAGSHEDYDKPSLEAIGSGEGNQAHGWGLYYAQDKNVADNYRINSSDRIYFLQIGNDIYKPESDVWKLYNKYKNFHTKNKKWTLNAFIRNNKHILNNLSYLKNKTDDSQYDYYKTEENNLKIFKFLKKNENDIKEIKPKGQVHKVDLPEDEYLLDEQKSFKEQSDYVKKALENIEQTLIKPNFHQKIFDNKEEANEFFDFKIDEFEEKANGYQRFFPEYFQTEDGKYGVKFVDNYTVYQKLIGENFDITGEAIYKKIAYQLGSYKDASEFLNIFGIKGITYYGRQDGRCYVIFNPNDVKVIDKLIREEQTLDEQPAYAGSKEDYDTPSLEKVGASSGFKYGWGLYYSKSPKTAENYYKIYTSNNDISYKGKIYNQKKNDREHFCLSMIKMGSSIEDMLNQYGNDPKVAKLLKNMKPEDVKDIKTLGGQIVKVDLPEDKYFMDWALPFDKQSDIVKKGILGLIDTFPKEVKGKLNGKDVSAQEYFMSLNGEDTYDVLKNFFKQDYQKASQELNRFGIKGIKYNDEGDGECFVVFNDKDVKVLDKLIKEEQEIDEQPAYCGASKPFDKADPKLIGKGHNLFQHGFGFYFTTDKESADYYRRGHTLDGKTGGAIMTVELPEDKYFINEDNEEQSEYVYKRLVKLYNSKILSKEVVERNKKYNLDPISGTGREIYDDISDKVGGAKKASELLAKFGIKGIIYFSRTDGKCFVIFSPDDIKVIEKQDFSIKESKIQDKTDNQVQVDGQWYHQRVIDNYLGDGIFDKLNIGDDIDLGKKEQPRQPNQKSEYILNNNFWAWFGNSKVVDKNGNPLVCYHGSEFDIKKFMKDYSGATIGNNYAEVFYFTSSEESAIDYSVKATVRSHESEFYDKDWCNELSYDDYAANIRNKVRENPHINPCFLKIENPFIYDNHGEEFDYMKIYTMEMVLQGRSDEHQLFDEDTYYEMLDALGYYDEDGEFHEDGRQYDGLIIKNIVDDIGDFHGNIDEYIVWNPNQIKSVNNKGNWSLYSDNINEEQEIISERILPELDDDIYNELLNITAPENHRANSYTKWLGNYIKNHRWQGDKDRIRTMLDRHKKLFTDNKVKPIMDYNNLDDLFDDLSKWENYLTKSEKSKIASKGAIKLATIDGYTIYNIQSREAARKYGENTKWCVTDSTSDFYFNKYTREMSDELGSKSESKLLYIIGNGRKFAASYKFNTHNGRKNNSNTWCQKWLDIFNSLDGLEYHYNIIQYENEQPNIEESGNKEPITNVINWIMDKYRINPESVENELNQLLTEQVAYHGTLHNHDKFSTNKIGSGNTGQTHGWGLYFTSSKKEAEDYKNRALKHTALYNGQPITEKGSHFYVGDTDVDTMSDSKDLWNLLSRVTSDGKSYTNGIKWQLKYAKERIESGELSKEDLEYYTDLIKSLKNQVKLAKNLSFDTGMVYRVELPDDEYLLKEDEHMSGQSPYVYKAIMKLYQDGYLKKSDLKETGGRIYTVIAYKLVKNIYNDKAYRLASEKLLEYGIKGILSFDIFNGKETKVFCIFSENDVKILDKNSEAKMLEQLDEANNSETIFYHGSPSKNIKEWHTNNIFWTTDREFAETYGRYIYSAKLDLGNTFNILNKQHFDWLLTQNNGVISIPDENSDDDQDFEVCDYTNFMKWEDIEFDNWECVEQYLDIIKTKFDSAVVFEQGTENYVIFSNNQIHLINNKPDIRRIDENLEHNITLYHASNSKFDNFDINYTNTKAHKEQMKGIWLSNSKKYIKQFGKIIYTCKVDNSNILNIDSDKYDKIINQFEKKYNIPFDLEGDNANKAQKYLIDNGYTGIYFKKEKGVYVYVIFDTNIIKIIENKQLSEAVTNFNVNLQKAVELYIKFKLETYDCLEPDDASYITYGIQETHKDLIEKAIQETGASNEEDLCWKINDCKNLGKYSKELVNAYALQIIETEYNYIRTSFEESPYIYRAIASDKELNEFIKDLQQYGTGNCWADSIGYARQYYGDEGMKYTYILKGVVSNNNIDWIKTLALNAEDETEQEIRLLNDKPIKVIQIFENNSNKDEYVDLDLNTGSKYGYDHYQKYDNLNESIYHATMLKNGDMFEVHQNPTKKEFWDLLNRSEVKDLRGVLGINEPILYVWDSYYGTHKQIFDSIIGKDWKEEDYVGCWFRKDDMGVFGFSKFTSDIKEKYYGKQPNKPMSKDKLNKIIADDDLGLLNEEIVSAQSNYGELYMVIYKNPTRKELSEDKYQQFRIVEDIYGNLYFANAHDFVHIEIENRLEKANIGYYSGDDYGVGMDVLLYDNETNTFIYRTKLDDFKDETLEEVKEDYGHKIKVKLGNSFKNCKFCLSPLEEPWLDYSKAYFGQDSQQINEDLDEAYVQVDKPIGNTGMTYNADYIEFEPEMRFIDEYDVEWEVEQVKGDKVLLRTKNNQVRVDTAENLNLDIFALDKLRPIFDERFYTKSDLERE